MRKFETLNDFRNNGPSDLYQQFLDNCERLTEEELEDTMQNSPTFILESTADFKELKLEERAKEDGTIWEGCDWTENHNWVYLCEATSTYTSLNYFIPANLVDQQILDAIQLQKKREEDMEARIREHNERATQIRASETSPVHKRCECEHISHTNLSLRTPNGNPGHRYGVSFGKLYVIPVTTPYGTFQVCKDCAIDCLGQYYISP